MTGQLSIFDYERVPDYKETVYFGDGYAETREYDEPALHMWDDLIARHGMIIDYKIHRSPCRTGEEGKNDRT